MFRRPLRPLFLLLMASLAAVPAARAAVPDVTDFKLSVTEARTTLGSDSFDVTIRVEGTSLNSGTIALASAPTSQLTLDNQAGVFGLDFHFSTEAQLNVAFPNGNYVLRMNNGNVQSTIAYTRPAVPSPAISFPGGGDVVPPGPITVLFTKCTICNQIGDSVKAVLSDDLMVELDSETLTSTSESWTPQDIGGDLVLPAQSAFVTSVTHKAVRQGSVAVTGDSDLTLLFTNTLIQGDEVDFETGFAAPSGHFCLAANHPTPPAGCATLSDPLLQIFDTSGMVSTTVAGHDVDYVVSVGAGGELTGTANADLDDSGSNETGPGTIKGKLSGGDGDVGSKLSFSLENMGLAAKLKVSVTDALSIPGDQLDRQQRASGAINGTKIKEDVPSSESPLPIAPLGWLLEFDLDSSAQVSNAVLTLEGGRTFLLTGTNKFNFAANQSSMKLSTAQKGVSVQLKKLGLDDSSDPLGITEGDVSYRALGQSGRVTLP